ncbi:MAG: cysteine-rich CWC family protein [Candidatus Accumulibacter sp.]|nr:cysteine-rich CWC family protein [Accumulibacter sp.]
MTNEESGGKTEAVCPRCGRRFSCGAIAGQRECWCMIRPALPFESRGKDCLCPACFDRLLSERVSRGEAHWSRLTNQCA